MLETKRAVQLEVNTEKRTLEIEARVTLLDALRDRLGLTGTKKGCDRGTCGACTVLVDGRRILGCLTLAAMHDGASVTTIEGLLRGETIHPMQEAFIKQDAFQCGYCTPGQILSAIGFLDEGHALDDETIAREMSGNICRCGAYENIRCAIREAAR